MISEEGENTMAKTKVICFTNNKGGSGKIHNLFKCWIWLERAWEKGSDDRRRYAAESLPFFV